MIVESCTCQPELRTRIEQRNPGQLREYYGYTIAVSVRVHFSNCPLSDEVLGAIAIKEGSHD